MGINKQQVVIVDDHPIFRLGLRELINQENDLQVCGEIEKPDKALDTITDMLPDIVLMDLSLDQQDDGLELIAEIRRNFKNLPILVISMYDESRYAEKAVRAGANGYITKQEALESVTKAIRVILDGNIFVSRQVMNDILSSSDQAELETPSIAALLTKRESEVFRLIGNGKTTKEIADHLCLSPKTIGTYRERIKDKLSIKHSSELIKTAVSWRINIDSERR